MPIVGGVKEFCDEFRRLRQEVSDMDICDKLQQAGSLTLGDEQPEWLKPEQAYFDMLLEAKTEIERLRADVVLLKNNGPSFREIKQEIKA